MQKLLITFFLTSVLLSGCSELTSDDIQSDESIDVKLALNGYNSTTGTESLDISSLSVFLFSNGNSLDKVYKNIPINNSQISLPIDYLQNTDAALYFIANIEDVSSGIQKYIIPTGTNYTSADPDKDLQFLTEKRIKLSKVPLGGKFSVGSLSHSTEINVNMDYAMARLNLQIEESNIEVDSICFRNLSTGGYLIEPQTPQPDYVGELFDYTERYNSPLTSSKTVGYINQQHNNEDIEAKIYGRFNGIKIAIPSRLPSDIKRNTTYTIRLAKVGSTLTATITLSDWKDGGTTESTPDVDAKVLIDPSKSIFDTGVSCSPTKDTLFIPSNRNSDILLSFDAQYELEATIAGNTADLSIENSDDFNRFRLKTNGQLPGSPAYYSYIMFRNKFFEDSYGERIVVCVAPNKDFLIADISKLASIPGIKVIGNLATVSEYGSKDITIPANKICVGTDIFASIQTFEDISTIGSEYNAIKLSPSGNSLIIQSVANTTGHPQAAIVSIKGSSTEGKKISAALSITIPPVIKDEIDVLNSLCTTMGNNVWMQFNTTGTYGGDIQRAKTIAALPGGITVNNIKTNFSLFGTFASYYNNVSTCPPGFRIPTQQQFCDLLGVNNTASLVSLNNISKGSVTTSGGMVATYYSFSTADKGKALVTISKGENTMYLTNGRYRTNPARGYIEFWHSGSFSAATAAANAYNWAGRCIKDVSYKGLN